MKRIPSILAMIALVATTAQAQTVTVQDVLQKNVDATGGADAWRAVKSLHSKGNVTVDTPMGVLVLGLEIWNVVPGYALIKQTTVAAPDGFPDLDQTIFLTPDGGWVDAPAMGGRMDVSAIPAPQRAGIDAQRASLNYASEELWLLDSKATDVTLEADGTVSGRPVYTVARDVAESRTIRQYDQESGLLIGVEAEAAGSQTKQSISDYRAVGGIMKPFMVEMQVAGMTQLVKFELIEVNIGLTADSIAAMANGAE